MLVRSGIVHVTIYAGARNPVPAARDDLSWEELCDEIEALAEIEYASKVDMVAFAPHRLHDDDRRTEIERDGKPAAAGAYRHLSNVAAVTLLVIDVDQCHASRLAEAIEALGVEALMYESPSSEMGADRVRVLAPISRELAPDECAQARFAFAEALGLAPGSGVEGAHDAAKLFFIGRLAGTPARRVWRFKG